MYHVHICVAYILLIYAHTQAKRDPVTAPEFRYKGVTLGDLISLKFDQRDSDEDAWSVVCEALVAANEAVTAADARRLLEGFK